MSLLLLLSLHIPKRSIYTVMYVYICIYILIGEQRAQLYEHHRTPFPCFSVCVFSHCSTLYCVYVGVMVCGVCFSIMMMMHFSILGRHVSCHVFVLFAFLFCPFEIVCFFVLSIQNCGVCGVELPHGTILFNLFSFIFIFFILILKQTCISFEVFRLVNRFVSIIVLCINTAYVVFHKTVGFFHSEIGRTELDESAEQHKTSVSKEQQMKIRNLVLVLLSVLWMLKLGSVLLLFRWIILSE